MKRLSAWAPLAGAVLLLSPCAAAEDDPFAISQEEAVVEAASRHTQTAADAPAAVTVITSADIARYGWTTLADVLRAVRGFYVINDLDYSYAGVRGVGRPGDYNNRLLVMVDGHAINGIVYEDALLGTEFALDLRALKRIEIVRGPISALYGSEAIFGAINLVTRDGGEVSPSAGASGGTAGLLAGRALVGGGSQGGASYLISASGTSLDGRDVTIPELDPMQGGGGTIKGADTDRGVSALFRLSSGRWSLEGMYTGRRKLFPTGSYGTVAGDSRNHTVDQRGFLEARMSEQLSSTLGLDLRGSVNATHYDGSYIIAADIAHAVENLDNSDAWWTDLEARLTKELGGHHHLQLGVAASIRPRAWQKDLDVDPAVVYTDTTQSTQVYSLYAQDEVSLAPHLVGTFALRYDNRLGDNVTDDAASPHAGLVYDLQGGGVLKLLAGSSFRMPSPYEEMYYSWRSPTPIAPERAEGLELEWSRDQLGGQTQFSAFADRVHDLISLTGVDTALGYVNAGSAVSYGLEGEWQGAVAGRGSATLALVVQHAVDEGGVTLDNSPTVLGYARAWMPWAGSALQTALEYQFISPRRVLDGSRTRAVHMVNANVSWRVPGVPARVSARVVNLLDWTYSDPATNNMPYRSIPQYGRAIRVGVSFGDD